LILGYFEKLGFSFNIEAYEKFYLAAVNTIPG